jgi:BirA family biotin operon repressor/biotin-[acetyl-CoA-carboxylase] ligase
MSPVHPCNFMFIGKKILRFKSLNSTNEYAKSIINTSQEGTVVTADEQIAGKGRFGRDWFSPRDGLWFSIILKPKKPSLVSLIIGIALCDSIKTLGLEPHIKWPNDIFINLKKVAGVLTEIEDNTIIVGIGLNLNIKVFPEYLKQKATSLTIEIGKGFNKERIFRSILENIEKRYGMLSKDMIKELLTDYRNYSIVLGKEVLVEMPNCKIEGEAIDIDEDGSLIVKTPDGAVQKVIAGNCTIQDFVYN